MQISSLSAKQRFLRRNKKLKNNLQYENSLGELLKVVFKNKEGAWHLWLTPVILAIWVAKTRRIEACGQPRQTVRETPSPK
jgi:hypothetical protein